MTEPVYTVAAIASMCHGEIHSIHQQDLVTRDLLIDSRSLIHAGNSLFVALVSGRNDGHRYIGELYEKGVRAFLVSRLPGSQVAPPPDYPAIEEDAGSSGYFPEAAFILVPDTLAALQEIGACHRRRFNIPVIGITGSNGKTIVKEWLFQLLSRERKVVRSPKSYNSQIGVPLSVWKMAAEHDLAIFEAGISKPGEMERLEAVIRPTIGIFTNTGHAHDEYFSDQREKVEEKLKLFLHAATLVYCADYPLITQCLRDNPAYGHLETFTWSRTREADLQVVRVEKEGGGTRISTRYKTENITFTIPFNDEASIENALHCFAAELVLDDPSRVVRHAPRYASLAPVAMRLELKEAINHCSLINDSYNSDISSLAIALDFLGQQNQHQQKTIILSDILQTGRDKEDLYREIASMLVSRRIDRIIGIGRDMMKHAGKFPMQKAFYPTTEEFLQHFPVSSFRDETILLKGARLFEFERISLVLQQKAHETVMEINLDALVHNLNHYRSLLRHGTKTMAMVKAFSYGSGSFEIANVLRFHRIDYLAVAYADEGVELRKAGISLPVMVMSPEEQSLGTLLKYNLEPEIYNLHILNLLEEAMARNQADGQQQVRIHIKLDTGMHRLGFDREEVEQLTGRLLRNPDLHVQSVFSHLAASDDPAEDDFSRLQIGRFEEMSERITRVLGYPVLRHILNSAGIHRFPEAQFDMVRLGIGLYGVGSDAAEQSRLRNVSTLKSVVTQVRHIPAGETIGYNRQGVAAKDSVIAVVPVGYADGLDRRLGNGRGRLFVNGMAAPVIGNICMDLVMIDVTPGAEVSPGGQETDQAHHPRDVKEGDEVIIFGDLHPIAELAREMGTIPYEVLTSISPRVKRIYYYE